MSGEERRREAGPAEQDRGNVLFYTGYCLKQLSRVEEAIPVLERAAELDRDGIEVFNLLGFLVMVLQILSVVPKE